MSNKTMQNRLFILDTNVLMHDPSAIFRFQEHTVYLPMVVLEELDAAKKGMSEVASNVRQVSRFLDELIRGQTNISAGINLPTHASQQASGKLFFQTELLPIQLPIDTLPGNKPDNSLLNTAIALQKADTTKQVTLVSKDINLRIKAHALGIHTEDYTNDKVLDDVDLLYTGKQVLNRENIQVYPLEKQIPLVYKMTGDDTMQYFPNQFLYTEDGQIEAIVKEIHQDYTLLAPVQNYVSQEESVWGITARNREQNFALNLLMTPEIDLVTLIGTAGSGKTLLALAAGLAQTLDQQRYREIIVTRMTVPVGVDIGFLPGTEEEKMTPWMGALLDNLEVLSPSGDSDWGRVVTTDILHNRIKIRSLNFMRGRTFLNRYIILDEAQNLTSKQMKTLITRAGPGTKIVCLGNIAQIDTPYLTETTSGLTYVIDRFKHWQHSGHIALQRGERSRLAAFASQVL